MNESGFPTLRPCPFCGGDAFFTYVSSGMYWVQCPGCGLTAMFNQTARVAEVDAHLQAVADAWNRRASQADVLSFQWTGRR